MDSDSSSEDGEDHYMRNPDDGFDMRDMIPDWNDNDEDDDGNPPFEYLPPNINHVYDPAAVDHERLAAAYSLLASIDKKIDIVEERMRVYARARDQPHIKRFGAGIYVPRGLSLKESELWINAVDVTDLPNLGFLLDINRLPDPLKSEADRFKYEGARWRLESAYQKQRALISRLSRPGTRALTVLALPNEILAMVIGCFEKHHAWPDPRPVKSIRRCRLTCRQFNVIASSFLCPRVRVAVDPSSLARFEDISRHPLISKSVKTVSFRLEVFKYQYGTSLFRFAEFAARLVEKELGINLDGDTAEEDTIPDNPNRKWGVNESDAMEIIQKMRPICESWLRLACNPRTVYTDDEDRSVDSDEIDSDGEEIRGEVSDEDKPNWDFLKEQYAEYKRLYEQQEDLVEKQSFYRRVAEAINRMPSAKALQFRDLDIRRKLMTGFPFFELAYGEGDPCTHLREVKFLLQREPLLWSFNTSFESLCPTEFILEVTDELVKVGRFPTSLEIKVFDGRDTDPGFDSLLPEPQKRLESAMQELVSFRFHSECPLSRYRDDVCGEYEIARFFAPFLDAPLLKEIHIHNHHRESYIEAPMYESTPTYQRVGLTLAAKPRPHLVNLSLHGVLMQERQLQSLLGSGAPRRWEKLELVHFGLHTGTWAGALESLRQLDCPSKRLQQVSGGEEFYTPMDRLDRYERDFERGYPRHESLSVAEKYIRGDDIPNPVTVFAQETGISYEEMKADDARTLEEERLRMLEMASYYNTDTHTDAPDSDSQMANGIDQVVG